THRPRPSGRSGPRKRPSRRPGAEATTRPRPENPEALAPARPAATLPSDRQATDVVLLDVRGMSSYADYFVLGSGDSERGVVATAEHGRETRKAHVHRTITTE